MSANSLYQVMSRPRSQTYDGTFPSHHVPDLFTDEASFSSAPNLNNRTYEAYEAQDEVSTPNPFKNIFNPFKRFFNSFKKSNSPIRQHSQVNGFSLQMIAIGGSIGTGLFLGSGKILSEAGILPVMIGYLVVSVFVYITCQALGELSLAVPCSGSFIKYATTMIDESWGYTMGWNYCLQWMFLFPLELVSFTLVLEFWPFVTLDRWILISILFVVSSMLNLCTVRLYGIFESVFSMIKVVTIGLFVVIGTVIDCGVLSEATIGFSTLRSPGMIVPNVSVAALFGVLVAAQFSFSGTELVGLAASQTKNPIKQVPKAIKQIFWRILLFYLTSLGLIGLLVPFDHPNLISNSNDVSASPFVLALLNSSFASHALSGIFNGVILVSILSVSHNSIYASSKSLMSMAENGQAPQFLGVVDRKGRPLAAIGVSSCFGIIAYLSVISPEGSKIMFDWLISINGLSVFFSYATICLCHIRFRGILKHKSIPITELPFKSSTGVFGSWCGVVFCGLVILTNTILSFVYSTDILRFIQENMNLSLVLVSFVIHKLVVSIRQNSFQGPVLSHQFTFEDGIFVDDTTREENKLVVDETKRQYNQLNWSQKLKSWIM